MNTKNIVTLACINMVIFFLLSGCSWHKEYGKLGVQHGDGAKMTIQALQENWQDFTIYYAGLAIDNPSAIMFDPKNDDRSLISDKWIQVKDWEEVTELITWIDARIQFYPKLFRILGPDNQLYGYMYSDWDHVHIKVVDERTLWVDDLPLPPIDYGPGRGNAV